jgi:hypothetical protein
MRFAECYPTYIDRLLDGTEFPISLAAMRPLKPYLIAVGGLITALFSAIFVGAHPGLRTAVPVTTPQPDLQSKTVVSTHEVGASRDARLASQTPPPPLQSQTADFPGSETRRLAHEFSASMPWTVFERMADRRALSLVGVVELRI